MLERLEERRFLTILFADISGFTKLSRSLDPEDVREIVNICFGSLNKIITKYGGTTHKYEGDLVISLFGFPVAHEDDPERAIMGALEMINEMPEINKKLNKKFNINVELGLHIGINTGLVVVGEVGSEEKKEWTIMGDAVNFTSRLKDISKTGEVVVSEIVYRQTRYLFDYERMEPIMVKGIDEPINVFKIIKIKDKPEPKRGITGLYSPVIGRDKEIDFLKNKIEKLYKGKGGVVFIVGEAGMGKSRLCEETKKYIINKFPSNNILEGQCLLYTDNLINLPLLQMIKQIFGIKEKDSHDEIRDKLIVKIKNIFPDDWEKIIPYIANFLSVQFGNQVDEKIKHIEPEILKNQTFNNLRRLFLKISESMPLIIFIEDFHWIDQSSLEFLEYMWENTFSIFGEMEEKKEYPILFICLLRPEKDKECFNVKEKIKITLGDLCDEIILTPLDKKSTKIITDNLLNIANLPDEFKDKIIDKAEGNPLYVEEIIRNLIVSGVIKFQSGKWIINKDVKDVEIPHSINAIITSRIDHLQSDAKSILQIASVIGKNFYMKTLEYCTGVDEMILSLNLAILEEAEYIQKLSKTNIQDEIEYTFRHPLIQEVVYNSILKKRRKEIHQKVGESIEKLFNDRIDDFVEMLSYQYYSAENFDKAYIYSLKSAKKAEKAYLNKQAIEFYTLTEKIIEKLDQNEENQKKLVEILIEKSKIHNLTGKNDIALEEINRGIEIARNLKDIKLLGECYLVFSEINNYIGEYDKSLNSALDALNMFREIQYEKGEADAMYYIGSIYLFKNDYSKALNYFNNSFKIYEKLKDLSGEANILFEIANLKQVTGEHRTAIEFYEKALKIYNKTGEKIEQARCLEEIAVIYSVMGKYDISLDYYRKCSEIYDKTGYKAGEALNYFNIGYLYELIQNFEKCREYYTKSLKLSEEINNLKYIEGAYIGLSNVNYYTGKTKESFECLEKALKISKKLGDKMDMGYIYNNLGALYNCSNEYDKAEEYLRESLKIFEEIGEKRGMGYAFSNLATLYFHKNDYDKSFEFYNKTFDTYKNIEDYPNALNAINFKIHRLTQVKRYKEAEEEFEKAEKIALEIDSKVNLKYLYNRYAELKISQLEDAILSGNENVEFIKDCMKKAEEYIMISENIVVDNTPKKVDLTKMANQIKLENIKFKYWKELGLEKPGEEDKNKLEEDFNNMLKIAEGSGVHLALGMYYYYSGEKFSLRKEKEKAIEFYKRSMDAFTKIGEKTWVEKVKNKAKEII